MATVLHANAVNVSEGLPGADALGGSMSDVGHGAMPVHGGRPPPTFRTTARTTPIADPGLPMPAASGRTRLAPLPAPPAPAEDTLADQQQQQQQQQAALAGRLQNASPLPGETMYQAAHHAFIPKTRKKSAAVGSGRGGWITGTGPAPGSAAAATALIQRAGMMGYGSDGGYGSGGGAEWGVGHGKLTSGPGAWGGASSVGDLEALDAILDQLVVLDTRMRQALLKGPLVSFETVVSESAARGGMVTEFPGSGNDRDHTFLTSVRGVVEEGEEEEGEAGATGNTLPAISGAGDNGGATSVPSQQQHHAQQQNNYQQQQGGYGQQHEDQHNQFYGDLGGDREEAAAYRAAIPVPILPKLARMYISSKQTAGMKAAPAPPPTAAWLLRSRLPMPSGAAPSYDNLVSQIKDVQRQYTCGTARDKSTLAAEAARVAGIPRSNLDSYISGIDGPPLADVVAPQLTPSLVERSRPSFVSMKRAVNSARRSPNRSHSKERLGITGGGGGGGGSPGATRGPSPLRGGMGGQGTAAAGHAAAAAAAAAMMDGPDVQGLDNGGNESS